MFCCKSVKRHLKHFSNYIMSQELPKALESVWNTRNIYVVEIILHSTSPSKVLTAAFEATRTTLTFHSGASSLHRVGLIKSKSVSFQQTESRNVTGRAQPYGTLCFANGKSLSVSSSLLARTPSQQMSNLLQGERLIAVAARITIQIRMRPHPSPAAGSLSLYLIHHLSDERTKERERERENTERAERQSLVR